MKIFTKLIITLLLTSLILLSVVFVMLQWSFDKGMLEYINKRDSQTLQVLSDNLAKYYQHTQDFSALIKMESPRPPSNKSKAFLNRNQSRKMPFPPRNSAKQQNLPSKLWHQILLISKNGYALPEDIDTFISDNQPRRTAPLHPPRRQNKDKREPPTSNSLHPTLLDKEMNIILGHYENNFTLKSITIKNRVIGYLATPPKLTITDDFDLNFIEQSQEKFAYIFILLFAFITLIAVPLSRHFVKPIKRLEQAMHKLNKGDFAVKLNISGNDELASLSRNFNDLALTLEQNKQSRNKWLADVSHELRTPLAILQGEIEAIQDGIRKLNFENLSSIAEEVHHLQKLINDLAELANAEVGSMRYQKYSLDLSKLVENNIERHKQQAENNDIFLSIKTTKNLSIWADDTRINQLLDNLLNNSFKYTDSPGKIFINVYKDNNLAVITIEDSAPGVPENSLNKLFEHLYRVENSRNRKTGGSGIGLALCKTIVTAHQGEISAYHSSHGGLAVRCSFSLIES